MEVLGEYYIARNIKSEDYQNLALSIDSKESVRVLKKAQELGLLVVFHAGIDIGLPAPYMATPEQIRNILTEMDGSNLIAAHLGGWILKEA